MARRSPAPFVAACVAVAMLCGLLAAPGRALAQASAASAPGGAPSGPPPEAIAACTGKAAGTQVSFSGHRGETFTGVCQLVNGVLAARPLASRHPGRPAAEALSRRSETPMKLRSAGDSLRGSPQPFDHQMRLSL